MGTPNADRELSLFREKETGVRFWITPLLSCLTLLVLIFLIWGLFEQHYLGDISFRELYYLDMIRGISSSVLLAGWSAWFVLHERRKWEKQLHRSWKRYQAMLMHAADAVILFDSNLTVWEWNPCAEGLYGYTREEVIGKLLPTLDAVQEREMRSALERLRHAEAAVELETRRRNRAGDWIDVSIRLSSFPDVDSGETVFLEVGSDLREQIRLRRRALEVERLTSMGRLSAGTAHILNTPLAAMSLQFDLLHHHPGESLSAEDLARLESSTHFCQEFVQKLLQFSRPTDASMTCVDVGELMDSI